MKKETGRGWELFNDDCVAAMASLPSESVDYSVSSIPFSSLFAYSADPRDLSNCDNHEQFFAHMDFVARELFRVIKPGRLVTTHTMTLPTSKVKDGKISLYDFPGDTIRCFERAGFLFHSKVVIFKNPVQAMQRTKARGLLWKELRKNSAVSRMGLPDEVLTFRKPGENTEPITHSKEEFPVAQWQQWASPTWQVPDCEQDIEFFKQCLLLWDDIDQGDVLSSRAAKEEDDQKHLCPLQKEVIRRCVRLWSNRGDLVLSPFAGIGSEGYVALQEGRRFIGAELKASYYRQAVANLQAVERRTGDLFANVIATPPPPAPEALAEDDSIYEPDEFDADGNPLPPPAYAHLPDDTAWREQWPMATSILELYEALSVALQGRGPSLLQLGEWHPSQAKFQEAAHWARIELANMNATEHPHIDVPGRMPMPEALEKLLKPAKPKRTRKPKAAPDAGLNVHGPNTGEPTQNQADSV